MNTFTKSGRCKQCMRFTPIPSTSFHLELCGQLCKLCQVVCLSCGTVKALPVPAKEQNVRTFIHTGPEFVFRTRPSGGVFVFHGEKFLGSVYPVQRHWHFEHEQELSKRFPNETLAFQALAKRHGIEAECR